MVSTLNHNAKAYHIYIHSLYWFHNAWSPLNSIALASCVRIVCRLAELVHWLYQRLLHSTLMWWPPVIAFTGKPLYQLIFCKILDARKFWSYYSNRIGRTATTCRWCASFITPKINLAYKRIHYRNPFKQGGDITFELYSLFP